MSKDEKEIPVINLFPQEYKVRTKRDTGKLIALGVFLASILLFYLAYLLLSSTSSDVKSKSGTLLVMIGTILLVGVILWSIRKRIIIFILAFVLLLTTYFMEGYIVYWFGLLPHSFSWGIVTLTIVSAFSYWFGTDIDWEDGLKVFLFIIVMYMLNASGWLVGANNSFHSMLSLTSLLHGGLGGLGGGALNGTV